MLLRVAGARCVPSRVGVGSVAHACRVAMLLSEYNQRSDGTGFSLGARRPGWFPRTVFLSTNVFAADWNVEIAHLVHMHVRRRLAYVKSFCRHR